MPFLTTDLEYHAQVNVRELVGCSQPAVNFAGKFNSSWTRGGISSLTVIREGVVSQPKVGGMVSIATRKDICGKCALLETGHGMCAQIKGLNYSLIDWMVGNHNGRFHDECEYNKNRAYLSNYQNQSVPIDEEMGIEGITCSKQLRV